MTTISRMIFSHWPLKLTALGLAVVLYLSLIHISEPTRLESKSRITS